jgi:hypothetical protein
MSTIWSRLVEKATPLSTRTLTIDHQELYAIVQVEQRLRILEDVIYSLQQLIRDNKETLCSQENNPT